MSCKRKVALPFIEIIEPDCRQYVLLCTRNYHGRISKVYSPARSLMLLAIMHIQKLRSIFPYAKKREASQDNLRLSVAKIPVAEGLYEIYSPPVPYNRDIRKIDPVEGGILHDAVKCHVCEDQPVPSFQRPIE